MSSLTAAAVILHPCYFLFFKARCGKNVNWGNSYLDPLDVRQFGHILARLTLSLWIQTRVRKPESETLQTAKNLGGWKLLAQ